jgi:hypothetical protein
VALTETIIEVFQGVGGTLGAGGGFLAAQVWRKFEDTRKAAKDAKKLVIALISAFDVRGDLSKIEPEALAREVALKLQEFALRDELPSHTVMEHIRELVQREVDKLMRGSRPDFSTGDPVVLRRLDELDRRVSAVEDDVDDAKREDRKWAEQMRETMGRIEGRLEAIRPRER